MAIGERRDDAGEENKKQTKKPPGWAAQIVEKHAYGGFFNENAPFAYEPAARRAANGDRNPLLRKGSETAVHAAGFGLTVRGLRPSDTSQVYQQAEPPG